MKRTQSLPVPDPCISPKQMKKKLNSVQSFFPSKRDILSRVSSAIRPRHRQEKRKKPSQVNNYVRVSVIIQVYRLVDFHPCPQRFPALADHGLELVVQSPDTGVLLELAATHLGSDQSRTVLGRGPRWCELALRRSSRPRGYGHRRPRGIEDGSPAQSRHAGGPVRLSAPGTTPSRYPACHIGRTAASRGGGLLFPVRDQHPVGAEIPIACLLGVFVFVDREVSGNRVGRLGIRTKDVVLARHHLPGTLVQGRRRVGRHTV